MAICDHKKAYVRLESGKWVCFQCSEEAPKKMAINLERCYQGQEARR